MDRNPNQINDLFRIDDPKVTKNSVVSINLEDDAGTICSTDILAFGGPLA